jgi:hypothetical protein
MEPVSLKGVSSLLSDRVRCALTYDDGCTSTANLSCDQR